MDTSDVQCLNENHDTGLLGSQALAGGAQAAISVPGMLPTQQQQMTSSMTPNDTVIYNGPHGVQDVGMGAGFQDVMQAPRGEMMALPQQQMMSGSVTEPEMRNFMNAGPGSLQQRNQPSSSGPSMNIVQPTNTMRQMGLGQMCPGHIGLDPSQMPPQGPMVSQQSHTPHSQQMLAIQQQQH
ncbi:unnamed protein product [Allacma fusca]|uniref:Uncharacterized protein n=1 Tax=Allacma fusca TaxID=39272 RepID=A0A8J2NP27_9HEXA|nr:unnamed protein product [Allacma fusca]